MTNRINLTECEWTKIYSFLVLYRDIRVRDESRCRQFIHAVLWILRTGSQWRQLPIEHGNWNSVFKRFSRWSQFGIWQDMLQLFALDGDYQHISIDSTVIRAHACSAGAEGSSEEQEALGRSKGGFSCKVHGTCEALGYPVRFILTPGQDADITQAIPLIDGIKTEAVLADKGYDADEFIENIQKNDAQAVIPPRANRKNPRKCDWWLYKERHAIECMFGKLKYYRLISSRFEKKAINYLAMLSFAGCLL